MKVVQLEREAFKVPEVARKLGISTNRCYELCNEGVIPSLRLGRRIVIPRATFDAWLANAGRG